MNVLMVEPGKAPYETQIGDDLQSMQAVVGGYIQAVYPYEEPVALIANESGKLDGLPLNRALRDADGDVYDIVAGKFFIVGSVKVISPTCRTNSLSSLQNNFGSRKYLCTWMTKSLPRRCRTNRRRAECHIDSAIENCPIAW